MDTRSLIDERTGIIRRLRPVPVPPELPACFEQVAAELSDITGFGAPQGDSAGAGYALGDPDAARAAAIGEAVERYCGNLVPNGLCRGSWQELTADGARPLDPESVALFAPWQYRRPGFPFRPMTRDLTMDWVSGTDLFTGAEVLVPASLVWVSHPLSEARAGIATNPIIQAGLAAGDGTEMATYQALAEVIERDAVTMAWHGRAGIRAVRPPRWLAALGKGGRHTLRSTFYEFTSDVLCVAGALVRDEHTGYLTMGTAARADPESALRKAFAEACQLQLFVAGYDDPDGPYLRAAGEPGSPLKPWRAAKDYRAAYRADLADAVDYGCHLQLFLDPEAQYLFEAELADATSETAEHTDLTRYPGDLGSLVDRMAVTGPVIAVDLTTSDVAASGLAVVRAVAPGRYSNSAAGLPFLGGDRLTAALDGRPRRALPLPH